MIKKNTISDYVERICISVNNRCNYACRYCYFFNPDNRITSIPSLDADDILLIIEQCFAYHQKYDVKKKMKINFVGSGEPLLNWTDISMALSKFWDMHPGQERIRLYLVTNASLITPEIALEMKRLKIVPSVSLDGPKEIHDINRLFHDGKGTFDATMKGISLLHDAGFDVSINTTISRNIIENVEHYLDFVLGMGFTKVIFDRLVDVPKNIDAISDHEYYEFLLTIKSTLDQHNITNLEIGNIEAYRRNLSGVADHVCTMFGGSCGGGSHFLIYLGKDVYPCGRMFGIPQWFLGNYDQDIDYLQQQMYCKIPTRPECLSCNVSNECIRDCILESQAVGYSCESRQNFLIDFKNIQTREK